MIKLTKPYKYALYAVLGLVVLAIVYTIIQNTGIVVAANAAIKKSQEQGFNPQPYAEAIYNDLTKGWYSSTTPSVYTNVLALNDEQIREVWRYYELNSKPKKGDYQNKSMRAAIDYATFYSFAAGVASDALMAKLLELQLS